MWSSETVRTARSLCAGLVIAVGLAALGGCQVKPLYGDVGMASNADVQAHLAAVSVPPAGSRSLLEFVRELTFRLHGGGDPAPVRYRFTYRTNDRTASLAVPVTLDEPTAISVTMGVDFVLSDADTGLTLLTGTSFATATYDYSTQRFANARAAIDAQDRAGRAVAEDISNRLAAYFSANPRPLAPKVTPAVAAAPASAPVD